jgi:hypothetical protein
LSSLAFLVSAFVQSAERVDKSAILPVLQFSLQSSTFASETLTIFHRMPIKGEMSIGLPIAQIAIGELWKKILILPSHISVSYLAKKIHCYAGKN